VIIGIDPGKRGGLAICDNNLISVYSFKDKSELEIAQRVRRAAERTKAVCYLEKVHSAPGQGVASMFAFGQAYGFIRGVISTLSIPIVDVTPQVWQRALRVPPKNGKSYHEHKKLLQEIAKKLYPINGVSAETADALLIMHYGRGIENRMDI